MNFSSDNKPDTALVYLLALNQHTPCEDVHHDIGDMRAHYIVVIDIEGVSSNESIIGLEVHLLRTKDNTNQLIVGPLKTGEFNVARLRSSRTLGQIRNIGNHTARDWAINLYTFACNVRDEMTKECGTSEWSAAYNCQTFAKKFIQALGIPFDEPVTGEQYSFLVNCVVLADYMSRNCNT